MSGWTVGAYVAAGAMVVSTAAQIDQQKSAAHQAKLIQEENARIAEAALKQQEEATRLGERAAAEATAAAMAQANEMRRGADMAAQQAQEGANQGAMQRAQGTELDRQRRQAEELARQAQKDESVQAPDVALSEETSETPRQRRRAFSSTQSTVRS